MVSLPPKTICKFDNDDIGFKVGSYEIPVLDSSGRVAYESGNTRTRTVTIFAFPSVSKGSVSVDLQDNREKGEQKDGSRLDAVEMEGQSTSVYTLLSFTDAWKINDGKNTYYRPANATDFTWCGRIVGRNVPEDLQGYEPHTFVSYNPVTYTISSLVVDGVIYHCRVVLRSTDFSSLRGGRALKWQTCRRSTMHGTGRNFDMRVMREQAACLDETCPAINMQEAITERIVLGEHAIASADDFMGEKVYAWFSILAQNPLLYEPVEDEVTRRKRAEMIERCQSGQTCLNSCKAQILASVKMLGS